MNIALAITAMVCITVMTVASIFASVAKKQIELDANKEAVKAAETLCKVAEAAKEMKAERSETKEES